jgi:hypothetical protein
MDEDLFLSVCVSFLFSFAPSGFVPFFYLCLYTFMSTLLFPCKKTIILLLDLRIKHKEKFPEGFKASRRVSSSLNISCQDEGVLVL